MLLIVYFMEGLKMAENITSKRIDVRLTDKEVELLEWFAKNEDITIQKKMQQIFYNQLQELKDLYLEEMEAEESQ